jgi:hypothetical protein
MTPLAESIVSGIAQGKAEAFIGAGEVALAFAAPNIEIVEPYFTQVRQSPPKLEDIAAIKTALLAYLSAAPRTEHAAVAFFALGRINDPQLISPLQEHLEFHLRELLASNAAVGNLICALSNLGEPIISGQHFSSLEIDKSVKDARNYLYVRGRIVRG